MKLFYFTVPQGEHVIKRDSTENMYTVEDWASAHDVYHKAENALNGKGQVNFDQSQNIEGFPERLLLPKGMYHIRRLYLSFMGSRTWLFFIYCFSMKVLTYNKMNFILQVVRAVCLSSC